jgi:tripartite-type tricarboxylate transporter receptor subunit TctC
MTFNTKRPILSSLITAAFCAAGLGAAASAQAQANWPTKPVRIVVAFAPGGGVDVMVRHLTQPLSELLGQSVVVDNKPGASGLVAAQEVSRAAADGYTMLSTATSTETAAPFLLKTDINPARELQPLAGIGRFQLSVVVRPGLAVTSIKDLVAMAKANPDKLTYASSGPGTTPHLVGELFLQQAGIQARHVPYKGSNPAMQATIAGETDFVFDPGLAFPHIRAGRGQILAVASDKRTPAFPNVPTVAEAGVPGVDIDTWVGLWYPLAVSADVVNRFNGALAKVLARKDVQDKYAVLSGEALFVPQPQYKALLVKEAQVQSALIKSRNIKAE